MITVLQFVSSLSDGGAETLVKDYGILFKRHPELQVRCVLVTLHNFKDSANYKRLKNSGVEIVPIIWFLVYSKKVITDNREA